MLSASDRAALLAAVGEDGLVLDEGGRAAYETAARYGGGRAAAVVRPRTAEEVSAVVGHCVRNGLAFVPQSGNTGLALGSTPDASGTQVVLSLDRRRAPLAVDAADRTVEVGAGVRLSALNAALAEHDLCLPIDLGADPMIGGMVATNTGGARFLRYGDMRRHVLGLEVVLPDAEGTRLTLSAGLRKDNAQLALRHLFVGGFGAPGVVTRAVLEVHPRPRQTAAAILVPRDEAAVLDLLLAFEREAGPFLTAFEGMSRAAVVRALAHVPGLRDPFQGGEVPPYCVLVELTSSLSPREGRPGLADLLEDVLADLAEAPGGPLADALLGPPERMWALRHALSEGLRACGPVIGLDLSLRRADIPRFRAEAAAMLARDFPEFEACEFGHVADGGVHFNLVRRNGGAAEPARAEQVREAVLALAVEGYGASFSGEHGLGRAVQASYDRFVSPLIQAYSAAVVGVFADASPAALRLGPPQ